MTKLRLLFSTAVMLAVTSASAAHASNNPTMDAEVARIGNQWAHIKYQVNGKGAQLAQIEALAVQAAEVVKRYPGRAEPLIWDGIVTSEEAALASPFHQLALANTARKIFVQAQSIDPKALGGGAPMSLGVLYYRVPGFPIGFGNNARAQQYLEAALAVDPAGLDANYFYGDFLMSKGEPAKARAYLQRALQAPADPARPVWDAGRRGEVRELLAKADQQAAH